MVLTLRNRLPFTRVHSHAVAQKSSGAFFRVMARERCWKWLTRYRVALRAFQAVRATDVMVNVTCFGDKSWFGHLGFIFVFLGRPPEKVTFPYCVFVSSGVVNHFTYR